MMETFFAKFMEGAKDVSDKLKSDITPSFLKSDLEIGQYQIEAAAHSAGSFFGIPDLEIKEGKQIGVYPMDTNVYGDEILEYNINQFKDMNCVTFEDQVKVLSHEMGHIILQKEYPVGCWADELGADFFVGVRAEMLGIGTGNFEKFIKDTPATASHPGGKLRLEAINFGRAVVAKMKQEGIIPTWENCMREFKQSEFAQYDSPADVLNYKGFTNDKAWHLNEARKAKEKAEAYTKEANQEIDKGNLGRAGDLSRRAEQCQKEAQDHMDSAAMCSK